MFASVISRGADAFCQDFKKLFSNKNSQENVRYFV